MVMVIAILASIAVPRFNAVTTAANTAKIQSDLSTIDTAIAIYIMENGNAPSAVSDLKSYLRGAEGDLKPPSGKCYITGDEADIPSGGYTIGTVDNEPRAVLGTNNTAEKFYTKKSG
jgi:general secretion pathway protein G